ncbi:MlaD family protein [Chitinibacter sp. GC72]|uniref:MlaD family protein n=1 Tax=Chitinibacter sp. GC72 TaxID=1526917 RepID=UPI0012F9ACA0|nr:MlaD family protein [Chitinibacter sp. GC72]
MKQHQFLKDIDPRFQLLGWRVGVFAAVIGLIIISLIAVLAERQGLFNPKTRLHFVAESGAGLAPGLQVRLSGFRIGVVDEVSLNEQAKVDVEILVEERYMKWIKLDSIALLQQDGVIGDHFIEISGGSSNVAVMQEGGVLTFAATLGLSDIALDLRNRTLPIFDSVQQTFDYLNDPKGDIRQTLSNVQQLTAEVRQTREKIDQLLLRTDGLLDQEVRSNLQSSQQFLNRADLIASEVAQQMPSMLRSADASLRSVDSITQDASASMRILRSTVEQSAPMIPGMVRDGGDLLRRSDQTLEAVQQIWPLSRSLERPALTAPVVESR